MAPVLKIDVFSTGVKCVTPPSSVDAISESAKATKSEDLTALSACISDTQTTPRRSPRKPARVMAEKSVSTPEWREKRRRATTPETPTKVPLQRTNALRANTSDCNPGPLVSIRTSVSMASSQHSYYEGAKELDDLFMQLDDQEVEELLDNNARAGASVSTGSSESCPGTTTSTITTFLHSTSCEENRRRRKRSESPAAECPHRRAKPESPLRITEKASKDTSKDPSAEISSLQQKPPATSVTRVATYSRKSKQDRPMLRPGCNPGHSAPTAETVTVSAVGLVDTDASIVSSIQAATTVSPMKPAMLVDSEKPSSMNGSTKGRVDSPSVESVVSISTTSISTRTTRSTLMTNPKAQKKASVPADPPVDLTIVAHDERKQQLMDSSGIAKAVQFEIARGVTEGWWSWEDITDGVVRDLRGSNFERAGKVGETIQKVIGLGPKEHLSKAVRDTRHAIYAELDREQQAFVENKDRGLGLIGPWQGVENWYGGRVQFTARLEINTTKDGPTCFVRLNSFGFGKSNRAARLVSSLSILSVKVDKSVLFDDEKKKIVNAFLEKPLIICGRYYRPFCAKEQRIFFVETKENHQREPMISLGEQHRLSFRKFVRTINPMDLNKDQAMNKWLARWQLILSTSRPVLEFAPENIHLDLDDVYAEGEQKGKKKAETIMTDGCGFINLSALRLIAVNTNSACPVVVQGRIAGAKGLWLLHPNPDHRSDTEPPKIWIRASQLKINLKHKNSWHRSLRIFDLVRLPRLTVPSSLYMQTIMNISFNGVKDKVFKKLMETGLQKEIEALTQWDGDNVCVTLAKAVEEAGGINTSRRARGAGADARLHGYVRDEFDDEDDAANNGGLVERDPISGCPQTLYESTRDMLLAGFTPLQSPIVREKLKYILKQTIRRYLEQYHIPVPLSAEAFIVPDPYGVLGEGEIFFRCSTPIGDPTVTIDPHTFLGPVLVTRNPTRVASDVRKVTAVSHDKLLSYSDVIIFSTKGERSLASFLGGGDYDGDTVTIIADPTIVQGFSNSNYVPEPPSVRAGFEEEVETVQEFISRVTGLKAIEKDVEIGKKVLRGLSDSKVGLYSVMHDCAVYLLGYDHPEAVRLAYMFCTTLDAGKSGLRLKSEIFRVDNKNYFRQRPASMQKEEESKRYQELEAVGRQLARPRELGKFVLDTLHAYGKELSERALIQYDTLSDEADPRWSKKDDNLAKPYEDMKIFTSFMEEKYHISGPRESLEKIEAFVGSLCEDYISKAGGHIGSRSPQKKALNGSVPGSKVFSQLQQEFARRFEAGLFDCVLEMPSHWIKEVKASYAHIYGAPKGTLGRGFAFVVAHDTLLAIKIQSKGGASIRQDCRDFVLLSSNLVKLVRAE